MAETPKALVNQLAAVQREANGHLKKGSVLNPHGGMGIQRSLHTKIATKCREILEKSEKGGPIYFEKVIRLLLKPIYWNKTLLNRDTMLKTIEFMVTRGYGAAIGANEADSEKGKGGLIVVLNAPMAQRPEKAAIEVKPS